jgi:uncharacterized protein (TIGR03067 family)
MVLMLTRRNALASCLALGLALPAWSDEPKATDEQKAEVARDLKKMQGEWVSKDDQGESTWAFKGDTLSLKTPTRAYAITITLDPTAKPIAAMDMKVSEDSPNAKGYTGLAIYKFEGENKLVICFGGGDAGRPTEFKSDTAGFTSFNFELKRK